LKRFLGLIMACCVALFVPATAFATETPENASRAELVFTGEDISNLTPDEQISYLKNSNQSPDTVGGIHPLSTVYGDAGSSWVYLNRVDELKSQASYGINCDYSMAYLTWGLAYSDGNSASGFYIPLGKDWDGDTVKDHAAPGIITVAFTATATTFDGKVLASLVPTDSAYIY